MKTLLLAAVLLSVAACKTTGERMAEGSASCNTICKDNPGIGAYTQKAMGGLTLLFVGGEEVKCECYRK